MIPMIPFRYLKPLRVHWTKYLLFEVGRWDGLEVPLLNCPYIFLHWIQKDKGKGFAIFFFFCSSMQKRQNHKFPSTSKIRYIVYKHFCAPGLAISGNSSQFERIELVIKLRRANPHQFRPWPILRPFEQKFRVMEEGGLFCELITIRI